MRTTFKLFQVIFMITFCIGLIACSDNEEPQELSEFDTESQHIIDKYKDMRIWYGRWDSKRYRYADVIFYSDGTCETKYGSSTTEGVWNYNYFTKLLSTTCANWTWIVNVMSQTEWSGTRQDGETFSYERNGGFDSNSELFIGKWVGNDGYDENTELSVTFKANKEYIFTKADSRFYGKYDLDLAYSPYYEAYEFRVYLSGDLSGTMTVRVLSGYEMAFYTDKELGRYLTSYEYPTLVSYKFIYNDFIE